MVDLNPEQQTRAAILREVAFYRRCVERARERRRAEFVAAVARETVVLGLVAMSLQELTREAAKAAGDARQLSEALWLPWYERLRSRLTYWSRRAFGWPAEDDPDSPKTVA